VFGHFQSSCRIPHRRTRHATDALPVGQQQPQFTHIGFINNLALAQRTFPLPRFLRQNVTGMGFIENKLTGARLFKPLRCRPVGFDFWHAYVSLSYSFMRGVALSANPLQISQYGATIAKKALARPDFYWPTPIPLRIPQRTFESRAGATQRPLKAM
jgi:hypothetical protein